uniref:HAT C-terminal dimerisation domain-containing protein n=1 Tax=Octopus bimaculoides TaxID=37653 RepID=A0A0L8H4H0_OCTBM
MARMRKGLVGQIRTKLEDLQLLGPLFTHCIIHQQALVPVNLQLVLIDLEANDLLKEKHREGKLVKSCRCLSDDEFLKLKKFAFSMAPVFGTTYVCEQTFSKMKYMKSAHRMELTDEHLKAILLVECSNSKANIDDILKTEHQFHKFH